MGMFGKTSCKRLDTCHEDLQLIMCTAVLYSSVDFGIAEGQRPVELQQKYFREGKSKVDGINIVGKHNIIPSLAADIYLWVNGQALWTPEALSYVAGVIEAVAKMLYAEGKITHLIRWGGNWDKDGEILSDQQFDDRPHFELYKPE